MADQAIKHFLLIYDHHAGELLNVEEFGGEAKKALNRYEALEKLYRDQHEMDIVLVGSDSLSTVKITHANYFNSADALGQIEAYLRGVTDKHNELRPRPS